MADTRHKNANWQIHKSSLTGTVSYEGAQLTVLMDIRDELQAICRRLDCSEVLAIPRLLREIKRNTARFRCRIARCAATYETAHGLDQHQRRTHKTT